MKKILIAALAVLAGGIILQAREVTGSVKCGKEQLSGVIVSDGSSFTLTGKNGKFKMDIADDADFVYVVTPAGYTAPFESGAPVFYQSAEGRKKFDFQLVRTSDSKDYDIVAIADPQTLHEKHFAKFEKTGLPDLYATVEDCKKEHLTVGITLGDICWDSMNMYPAYKEAISKTGIPFYTAIGNHDHQKDLQGDHNTSSAYRAAFGPENYAFGIGNDYMIVLDNIIYDTQKKYVEGYADSVLAWVKGLLEYIPETSHIFISQHAPFIYWFKDYSYARNGEKLLEMLDGRQVTFLSGHTHINNNFDIATGIKECNVAAICGISPAELARKNLIPVIAGIIAMGLAALFLV